MTEPHVAVVCRSLRARPGRTALSAAADAAGQCTDWDAAFAYAEWHQVEQLVSHVLGNPVVSPVVPSEALARFRRRADQRTTRTLHLMGHLDEVLAAFSEAGVDVMLLKGAALVDTVYPGFGLRTMADLDLLVRERDMATAEATADRLGFRASHLHGGPAVVERMRREHRHLPTVVDGRGVALEIHRYLDDVGGIRQADRMWGRARPSGRPAGAGFVPSFEDMLLHLAVHFAGDRKWTSAAALRQVTDMAETLRHVGAELDWDLVVGEAVAAQQERALFFGLYAVHELIDATLVPARILARCRPTAVNDALARRFLESRVLSSNVRLPIELIAPRKHPVRRLFLPRSTAIARHHLEPTSRVPLRFYGRRIIRAAGGVASHIRHPRTALGEAHLTRVLRGR